MYKTFIIFYFYIDMWREFLNINNIRAVTISVNLLESCLVFQQIPDRLRDLTALTKHRSIETQKHRN